MTTKLPRVIGFVTDPTATAQEILAQIETRGTWPFAIWRDGETIRSGWDGAVKADAADSRLERIGTYTAQATVELIAGDIVCACGAS